MARSAHPTSGLPRRRRKSLAATIEAWLVVGAIALTVWLLRSGTLAALIDMVAAFGPISGFFAGLLYSTFVTTPLAIGGFIEITHVAPLWQIALLGSAGATLVDMLLVRGSRSPLIDIIMTAIFGPNIFAASKRFAEGRLRWLAMILGAILVAIPLPTDELGVILLGASHVSVWRLMPLIFIADFIGIYVLLLTAQVL